MKKIIATVLAMVMALALCTTAFAAGKTAIGDDVDHVIAPENTEYALVKVLNAHDKVLDAYQIQTTVTDPTTGAKTISLDSTYYSVATEDSYDKVFVNGKEVTYLQSVAANTSTTAATKVTTVKAAKTDKAHGDIWTTGDVALFVDADDVYYVPFDKGTAVYLNVGGKMVKAEAAASGVVSEVPHSFTATVATDKDGNKTYTDIKCSCGKTYTAYATSVSKAVTTFGVNAYETITVNGNDTLYVAKAASGSTTTTGTTTSPKTFDAGIAMYVGMALTSVAGSAVVIGKKKEF